MAPKSRAPSGTCTASCRCRPSARISITASLKRTRHTGRSGSKSGCTRVSGSYRSAGARKSTESARRDVRRREHEKATAEIAEHAENDLLCALSSALRGCFSRIPVMLMPKKVKYRKQQRGRMAGKAWRGSDVTFGDYGLRALEPCWLTDRQIEAARVAMTRFIARGGKIWVRVFPDKPITKKPQETRMGKGKGAPEQWVCVVRPGKVLFEMEGISEKEAREAMKLAADKLPILTMFASRFAQEKML